MFRVRVPTGVLNTTPFCRSVLRSPRTVPDAAETSGDFVPFQSLDCVLWCFCQSNWWSVRTVHPKLSNATRNLVIATWYTRLGERVHLPALKCGCVPWHRSPQLTWIVGAAGEIPSPGVTRVMAEPGAFLRSEKFFPQTVPRRHRMPRPSLDQPWGRRLRSSVHRTIGIRTGETRPVTRAHVRPP